MTDPHSILDDVAAALSDPKIAAAEAAYWEAERRRSEALHRMLARPLRIDNAGLLDAIRAARTRDNPDDVISTYLHRLAHAIPGNESAGGPNDAILHQASTGKVYRYGPGPRPCTRCGRRSYTPLCWGCHGIADLGTIRPPADHMGDA